MFDSLCCCELHNPIEATFRVSEPVSEDKSGALVPEMTCQSRFQATLSRGVRSTATRLGERPALATCRVAGVF